jgi:hypothetical protein
MVSPFDTSSMPIYSVPNTSGQKTNTSMSEEREACWKTAHRGRTKIIIAN